MAEERRFYWLKLKEDFFDDETISYIEEQESGILYSNFYLKLCLKALRYDGHLIRVIGETCMPYDTGALAKLTGVSADVVEGAMKILKQIGLVQVVDGGELFLSQLQELTGKETATAERMRRSRARKKSKRNNVTPMLHQRYTEKEIEKEKELEKELEEEKDKGAAGPLPLVESTALNQALKDFADFRKKIKKPLTERAGKLLLKRLEDMAPDDETRIAILNQSIMNGWTGLYPLKNGSGAGKQGGRYEHIHQWAEEAGSDGITDFFD